jgi:hypothetical protein
VQITQACRKFTNIFNTAPAFVVRERVDVTVYAGPFAAYTTNDPTRPTLSSTDPRNQGTAALEILFHETSHGMIRRVSDAINAAQENAHRSDRATHSAPLWHDVLLFCLCYFVVYLSSSIARVNWLPSALPGMFPMLTRMDCGSAPGPILTGR